MSTEELQKPKLRELLETSIEILEEVKDATQRTGSKPLQKKVTKALNLLEKASDMLLQLDLFIRNDDWEEIASTDLKYLLLPAVNGELSLKLAGTRPPAGCSKALLNFRTRSHNYHMAEFQLPWAQRSSQEGNPATTSDNLEHNLVAMASKRQAKIHRYKQKKAVFSEIGSGELPG